jgi:hypothetical protein
MIRKSFHAFKLSPIRVGEKEVDWFRLVLLHFFATLNISAILVLSYRLRRHRI